jgi:hypothetical protein
MGFSPLGPTSRRPMYACRGGPFLLLPAGLPLVGSWRRGCSSSLGRPLAPPRRGFGCGCLWLPGVWAPSRQGPTGLRKALTPSPAPWLISEEAGEGVSPLWPSAFFAPAGPIPGYLPLTQRAGGI